ncbi:MAG: c-type cytochrome [Planctomycetaceae bacterium]|jgi:DNA-binding beta-propeller fold protein YncE|nr:c-type cytochrome [Planctomycetaceae bacterium]
MKRLVIGFIFRRLFVFLVGFVVGGFLVGLFFWGGFEVGDYLSFDLADKDKDGVVDKSEFRKVLIQHAKNNNKKLSRSSTNSTITNSTLFGASVSFDVADKNKDGNVDMKEFQQVLLAANKNGQLANLPFINTKPQLDTLKSQLNVHDDCPIEDMPADVRCNTDFVWQGGTKTAVYKSPNGLVVGRGGTVIFVLLRDTNAVAEFDVERDRFVRFISVAPKPNSITVSGDNKFLFVASGEYNGRVQVIDIESGKILRESKAGHTPVGVAISPDARRLFVCNRFSNDVFEYALPELVFIRQVKVVREPTAIVVSRDGGRIFVTNSQPDEVNNYPDQPDKKIDVAAELTVIDAGGGGVKNYRLPKGSCNVNGMSISPSGEYLYLTHLISHYWNGTDKVDLGQMNGNVISVINLKVLEERDEFRVSVVTLDDVELGAANPFAVMSDGGQIYVTCAGTDELITVNAEKLHERINKSNKNDLSSEFNFLDGIKKRIKLTGKGARSIAVSGQNVFVGLYFSDKIQRINFSNADEVSLFEVFIGELAELSQDRAGEMYWNDATLCHQNWQSCASCHPDARMTAVNWDLLHDGTGNPKNTKSLLLSHQTPPTMWLGDRRHAMQCTRTGFRFIMFSMPQRDPCFSIDEYTRNMKPVESPFLVNGKLSAKAERGKKIFYDSNVGCGSCHSGQYFTDLKMYDVGSEDQYTDQKLFDTPTLVEVWRTAPYLHDGRYKTVRELLKVGKHGKENGNIEQLTDVQIDELVEYILSL